MNRPVTHTDGRGLTTTFTYDTAGNLASVTAADGTTRYLRDTNGSLAQLAVEDRRGSGDDRVYVWSRGLVAMRTSSGTLHYSRDALGNITETTDESGAVAATYSYDAWGNDAEVLADPDVPENPFRFTGEYLDTDTGLYNLRARQYDPETGRFTQTDPLPQPADQPCETAYAYAKDRPTALVDPTGRRCEEPEDGGVSDTAALVGGLAAAAAFEAYLLLMSTMALPLLSVAYLAPVILLAAATTAAVIAQPAAAAEECKCQVADSAPIHHIATDKRTSTWTPRLREIFENAGLDISREPTNRIPLQGHRGRHLDVYNEAVFERLLESVARQLHGTT